MDNMSSVQHLTDLKLKSNVRIAGITALVQRRADTAILVCHTAPT